jgi:ribosomal protein L35AE/L33A
MDVNYKSYWEEAMSLVGKKVQVTKNSDGETVEGVIFATNPDSIVVVANNSTKTIQFKDILTLIQS